MPGMRNIFERNLGVMALDLLTVDEPAGISVYRASDGQALTLLQGPNRMNKEQIVDAVKRATTEVMSTMLSMEAQPKEVYMENLALGDAEGVVSFIGLTGPFAGTGGLQCTSEAARHFASKFLMTEFPAVTEEVLDAFGELTNMIIGSFKTEVETIAGPMGLSIPTVIYGRNFTTRSLGHEEWVVVPFDCAGHKMEVKVCLKAQKAGTDGSRQGAKPQFILG